MPMIDIGRIDPDPSNLRRVRDPAADAALRDSMKVLGQLQPILVRPKPGDRFEVVVGHRRLEAMRDLGREEIEAEVRELSDADAKAAQAAENEVREDLNPVDRFRQIKALLDFDFTPAAAALALGLTEREVRKLQLLGGICPAMLDAMAAGDMPAEAQLRTIALAGPEKQAAVWKSHRPKRKEKVNWNAVAAALTVRSISRKLALFDDEAAERFGVRWQEDLFAQADDAVFTEHVAEFLRAQRDHVQRHMIAVLAAEGITACIAATNERGHPAIPKGAQSAWLHSIEQAMRIEHKAVVRGFAVLPDGRVAVEGWTIPHEAAKKEKKAPKSEWLTGKGIEMVEKAKREAAAGAVVGTAVGSQVLAAVALLLWDKLPYGADKPRRTILRQDGTIVTHAKDVEEFAAAVAAYAMNTPADARQGEFPLSTVERIGAMLRSDATLVLDAGTIGVLKRPALLALAHENDSTLFSPSATKARLLTAGRGQVVVVPSELPPLAWLPEAGTFAAAEPRPDAEEPDEEAA
jgi:ParB family transcriptional regulator, chromosome partitioning protein